MRIKERAIRELQTLQPSKSFDYDQIEDYG